MKNLTIGINKSTVSAVSLGCMNFGTKTDYKTSFELLDTFYDLGGNFLDTANNYAFWNNNSLGGDSESVIGSWMAERKNRNHIFVATKIGARPINEKSGFNSVEGLSAVAIVKAVESCLKRLKINNIDLLFAHIDDNNVEIEETIYTFDQLIKQGKIREIGCSNFTLDRLNKSILTSHANDYAKYCCIQNRYTYLQPNSNADLGIQETFSKQLIEFCMEKQIQLLAYSPLLHGYYNRQNTLRKEYINKDNKEKINIVNELSTNMNITPNQLVLCWIMQSFPPIIPIVAASDTKQLIENMGSLKIHLSNQVLNTLDASSGILNNIF